MGMKLTSNLQKQFHSLFLSHFISLDYFKYKRGELPVASTLQPLCSGVATQPYAQEVRFK